jgi:hypothetical protein
LKVKKTLLSFPGSSVRRFTPPKDDGKERAAMTLAEKSLLTRAQSLIPHKGGKFEMNRSQCPVAKILVYKIVHEFLPTGFH